MWGWGGSPARAACHRVATVRRAGTTRWLFPSGALLAEAIVACSPLRAELTCQPDDERDVRFIDRPCQRVNTSRDCATRAERPRLAVQPLWMGAYNSCGPYAAASPRHRRGKSLQQHPRFPPQFSIRTRKCRFCPDRLRTNGGKTLRRCTVCDHLSIYTLMRTS